MRRVISTTFRIERGHDMYYRLRVYCNAAGEVSPAWEEVYEGLLWTEVVDIILEEADARRPGWALDEGRRWSMAPLFEEE